QAGGGGARLYRATRREAGPPGGRLSDRPVPPRARLYRRGMDNRPAGPCPVVVITGAAGGLGAATAELFVDRGWHVVAADLTAPSGAGMTSVATDVTDAASLAALASTVEARHGRLDLLITFAGVLGIGRSRRSTRTACSTSWTST